MVLKRQLLGESNPLCFTGPLLQQLWTALHKLCKWVPTILFQQGHFQGRASKPFQFVLILRAQSIQVSKYIWINSLSLSHFHYLRRNIAERKFPGRKCIIMTIRPALTSFQQSPMEYFGFWMTRVVFHRCVGRDLSLSKFLCLCSSDCDWNVLSLGHRPHLPSEMSLSSWPQSIVFQAKNASSWICH